MPQLPSAPPLPRPPLEQQTDADGRPIWHTVSVDDALTHLATASHGLSSGEAAHRLQVYGPNELTSLTRESAWRTFAAQFKNALIVILLCATRHFRIPGAHARSGRHHRDRAVCRAARLLSGIPREPRSRRLASDGGADRTRASRRSGDCRSRARVGPRRCGAAARGRSGARRHAADAVCQPCRRRSCLDR